MSQEPWIYLWSIEAEGERLRSVIKLAITMEEMKRVMDFEMKLALISLPREQMRNHSAVYNPTTLGKFPSYEGMPKSWKKYVESLYNYDDVQNDIDNSERIIVSDIDFYTNLILVLKSTEKRTLANYAGWMITMTLMSKLDSKARDIEHKYNRAMYGIDQKGPRWKTCVAEAGFNMRSTFKHAAGSMYAKFIFQTNRIHGWGIYQFE